MPYQRRSRFFQALLLIFIISLPVFIFYTSGYRLSFEDEGTKVVTTGGIYITTDELEVDVYLDEERVERPRLFRSAYYVQNIEVGKHRVVVQGSDLQTWVKELPVDAYIVTEAAAFNMPAVPHIRPIAEYLTQAGDLVFFANSTSTILFPDTTTTVPYLISTKKATTTYNKNQEYEYVVSLFSATSTKNSSSIIDRIGQEIQIFQFATTANGVESSTTVAYPYVENDSMRIVDKGDDIYALWAGDKKDTPHYFCVTGTASSSIATRYGEHVAAQIDKIQITTTDPLLIEGARFCRTEIRLDRKWQQVSYFEFLPNTSDLVVLKLEDGLYVTEIDDRAWQNTQRIYSGSDFEVVVTDNNIYISENGRYFEILTQLVTN